MVGLRRLLHVSAAYLLLSQVSCQEDADKAEGEEGTCSATNPGACSEEEKKQISVNQQLLEEGNDLAGKEDYEGALKLYLLALNIDNKSEWAANPMVNAGLALKAMKKDEEAINFLRKGVKLNPNLFHGQYNFANLLTEKMYWGEADAAYSAAVELAPQDSLHHVLIGYIRLLLRLYHYEEGRSALKGRDVREQLGALAGQLAVLVKKTPKPALDLISLCSNSFVIAGKLKANEAFSTWAVKQGVWKDIRQRPSSMNLKFADSYKATPWWNPKGGVDLPDFLEEISDNWKSLQKEFDSMMKKGKLQAPEDSGASDFQWYDKSKGHEWRQFEVFLDGQKNFANAKSAKTAARLFGDTQVKGDDEARMFYSALMPGSRTMTRCGVNNIRMTCYLGLRVPNVDIEKHAISVSGEARGIKEGAWACFDDSFEHTIYNEADEVSGTVVVQFRHPAAPKPEKR